MTQQSKPVLILLIWMVLAILTLWPTLMTRAQTKKAQPAAAAQASPSPSAPSAKTSDSFVTDGGAGPCSVDFTVTDAQGKPVFAALISVHLAYGFGGFHKLDMSVYTSQQGKATFLGIPAKVKNPPIEFHASKEQLTGAATVNPATECQAKHDIVMDVPKKTGS